MASAAKMALLPMGSSTSKFSTTLRISGGNGMPRSVAVNYTPCSLVTVSATGSPKNPAPPAPPSPPMPPPVPAVTRAPALFPLLLPCALLVSVSVHVRIHVVSWHVAALCSMLKAVAGVKCISWLQTRR